MAETGNLFLMDCSHVLGKKKRCRKCLAKHHMNILNYRTKKLQVNYDQMDISSDLNYTDTAEAIIMKKTKNNSNKVVETIDESDSVDSNIDVKEMNDTIEIMETNDVDQVLDRHVEVQQITTDNEVGINMPLHYAKNNRIEF